MVILVTGANGQLGNEMRIVSRNSDDSYIFTDVNQVEGVETAYLDITDIHAVREMVNTRGVNVIVNWCRLHERGRGGNERGFGRKT